MSKDNEILPFYLRLKEKRELENLDITKISNDTKINAHHLRAIESGDFNTIPITYLRLFIKTYSEYLKLDFREILNQYELESSKKNKTIFKKEKKIKIKKEKNNFRNTISHFKRYDSYYIEPKKIIQVSILFTFIISTYLLISYLSSKQQSEISKSENSINSNTEIKSNENNVEINESEKLYDNILLNSTDFPKQNLIKSESFKLNKEIDDKFIFQISTKEKTKIYISYNNENGDRIEKCNLIAKKGELIKYTFSNNIYFDLLSAQHVQVSINNNSINKYLGKKDYSIRGSFEPDKKQLYLEFYSK